MTLLVVCSVSIGLMLGLRFRVFILPPIILLGGILIGIMSSESSSETWLAILLFATLLQVSYFGGALLKASGFGAWVASTFSRPKTPLKTIL